jgi:hypothetical protein
MRRTVAFERIASEPEVLDRDMTPADIAAALQRLRFGYNRRQLVALDEEPTSVIPFPFFIGLDGL